MRKFSTGNVWSAKVHAPGLRRYRARQCQQRRGFRPKGPPTRATRVGFRRKTASSPWTTTRKERVLVARTAIAVAPLLHGILIVTYLVTLFNALWLSARRSSRRYKPSTVVSPFSPRSRLSRSQSHHQERPILFTAHPRLTRSTSFSTCLHQNQPPQCIQPCSHC